MASTEAVIPKELSEGSIGYMTPETLLGIIRDPQSTEEQYIAFSNNKDNRLVKYILIEDVDHRMNIIMWHTLQTDAQHSLVDQIAQKNGLILLSAGFVAAELSEEGDEVNIEFYGTSGSIDKSRFDMGLGKIGTTSSHLIAARYIQERFAKNGEANVVIENLRSEPARGRYASSSSEAGAQMQ